MVELEKNVGRYDRAARGILGIVALVVGLAGLMQVAGVGAALGTYVSVVVALVGVILLFTVATGSCAAYTLLGVDTCDVAE